jgi:hypothetical protein
VDPPLSTGATQGCTVSFVDWYRMVAQDAKFSRRCTSHGTVHTVVEDIIQVIREMAVKRKQYRRGMCRRPTLTVETAKENLRRLSYSQLVALTNIMDAVEWLSWLTNFPSTNDELPRPGRWGECWNQMEATSLYIRQRLEYI